MDNDVKGVSNTGGKQLLEKRNLREEASLRQSQTKRVVDPPGLWGFLGSMRILGYSFFFADKERCGFLQDR